jgi:hypothetical protein
LAVAIEYLLGHRPAWPPAAAVGKTIVSSSLIDRCAEPTEGTAGLEGSQDAPVYQARVPAARPASDYTPRVVPHHPQARIPLEAPYARWPR